MKLAFWAASAALMLLPPPASAAMACHRLSLKAAVALQDRILKDLKAENRADWDSVATQDFVAHENGKAYGRIEFFDLVAGARRSGVGLSWSVTDPTVNGACGLTLLQYVNRGVVTRDGVAKDTRWLETSAFRWENGAWRVALVTSMVVKD